MLEFSKRQRYIFFETCDSSLKSYQQLLITILDELFITHPKTPLKK